MNQNKQIKSLNANYKKFLKDKENKLYNDIEILMDDQNAFKWYVLFYNFSGDKNEYINGEYLIEVIATSKYPFEPPEFYIKTPNGVYGINNKVCISIGEFHKSSYIKGLKMVGFIVQLLNGIICWKDLAKSGGIRILKTSIEEKVELASQSHKYNWDKYPKIMQNFKDLTNYGKSSIFCDIDINIDDIDIDDIDIDTKWNDKKLSICFI